MTRLILFCYTGTSEKVFTVEMIVTVLNVEFEEALGSEDSSEYSNLKEQFCTEVIFLMKT